MATDNRIGLKVVVLGVAEAHRQIGAFRNDLTRAASDIGRSTDSINKFGRDLVRIGDAMVSFGRTLTFGVTAPILGLGTAFLKAGIDFEDAFAGVSKTVDGVAVGFKELAEEMYGTSTGLTQAQKDAVFANKRFGELTEIGEDLRQKFRDLSLEIPITANELARVGQVSGQLGIEADQLTEFTKTVALLGTTTDLSSEEAAFALARLGNIMGVEAQNMSQFALEAGNAIVALGNNAAATEPEIVNLALRVAGAGRAVGLTTQQILGISTTLAEVGVRAELGGSAISRILLEMSYAANDFANVEGILSESTGQVDADLELLRQQLQMGVTDVNELKLALQGTTIDLTGMSSVIQGLSGDYASLDEVIEGVRLRSLTKIEEKWRTGKIEIDEYQESIQSVESDVERLRAELSRGVRDVDSLNYTFAGSQLVLTGISRDLENLGKNVRSVDDVINIVRQNTLAGLQEDVGDVQRRFELFAKATGLSVEQLKLVIKNDPSEALKRILIGLADMQEQGTLTNDTLTELGLNTIRLKDVMNRLGPNAELMTENIELANQAWAEQIALQEEATKRFRTLKSQLQLLKNAFTDLGIEIFDLVRDDFAFMVSRVRDLIKYFKDLDPVIKGTIIRVSLLAAAIGPLLLVAGTFTQISGHMVLGLNNIKRAIFGIIGLPFPKFGSIIDMLLGAKNKRGKRKGGLFSGITNIFKDLTSSFRLGWGSFVNAISGGKKIVGKGVEQIFESISGFIGTIAKGFVSTVTSAIKLAFEGINFARMIGNVLVNIASVFTGGIAGILAIPAKILAKTPAIFAGLVKGIGSVLSLLGTTAFGVLKGFGNIFLGVFKMASGAVTNLVSKMLSFIPVLGKFLFSGILGIFTKLPLLIAGVGAALTAIFAPQLIRNLIKNWDKVLGEVRTSFGQFVTDLKNEGLEKAILLFTSGGSTGSGRKGGLLGIAQALGASENNAKKFAYSMGVASHWVIQIVKSFGTLASRMVEVITGAKSFEHATESTSDRINTLSKNIAKFFEGFFVGWTGQFDSIVNAFSVLVDEAGKAFEAFGGLFDAIFGTAKEQANNATQTFKDELEPGIETTASRIGEIVGEVLGKIITLAIQGFTLFTAAVTAITNVLTGIVTAYKEGGVKGVLEELRETGADLWKNIKEEAKDIWPDVRDALGQFLLDFGAWVLSDGLPAIANSARILFGAIRDELKRVLYDTSASFTSEDLFDVSVISDTGEIVKTYGARTKKQIEQLQEIFPDENFFVSPEVVGQQQTFEFGEEGLLTKFMGLIGTIGAWLEKGGAKILADALGSALTMMSDAVSNAWTTITGEEGFVSGVIALFDSFANFLSNAWEGTDGFTGLKGPFGDLLGGLGEFLGLLWEGTENFAGVKHYLNLLVNEIVAWIPGAATTLGGELRHAGRLIIKEFGLGIAEELLEQRTLFRAVPIFGPALEAGAALLALESIKLSFDEPIQEATEQSIDPAEDAGHTLGAAALRGVQAGLTPSGWQQQLVIFAQQHIAEWQQQGIDLGEDIVGGIESGMLTEQQALDLRTTLIAQGIIDGFTGTLQTNSPSLVMFGIGQDVMFGLYDGLQAQVAPLQSLLDSIVLQFIQFGLNISSTLTPVYTELQTLTTFVQTTLSTLSTSLSTAVNSLFSGGFPATTNNSNTTMYNTFAPQFANVGQREYSASQSMYSQWSNSAWAVG